METEVIAMATVPHIKMPLPGPRAAEIVKRDSKYVSPSYTRDYPLVIAKGRGARQQREATRA